MKPKYLYIDDEDKEGLVTFANGFNDTQLIDVEILDLHLYNNFEKITNQIVEKWNDFEGFLLDLRLNGEGENRQKFSATTLAQFIRSYSVENQVAPKAIVLCSTDYLLANFKFDSTSQDLFDYSFDKSFDMDFQEISIILLDLVKGYNSLNKYKESTWCNALGRTDEKFDYSPFSEIETNKSNVNKFARFLLSDVLSHTGLLIDEYVLASRLGINKDLSKDWSIVLSLFSDTRYKGVFSEIKRLYWNDLFLNKFRQFSGGRGPAPMRARERVEVIKNVVESCDIQIATPLEYTNSTMFWNVCEFTKRPIDPLDGFMLKEPRPLIAWQEPRYASFYSINQGLVDFKELREDEYMRYRCELEDMKEE